MYHRPPVDGVVTTRDRGYAALGMCGICGIVQIGGEPREVIAPASLDVMTDVMTHRGPDDRGTYKAPGIALGVRRLSIVDVQGGHQPVVSEDGSIVAIQNGELYNHTEIRQRLRSGGHVFASLCDTEILPHLYEQHGTRFFVYTEHERKSATERERRMEIHERSVCGYFDPYGILYRLSWRGERKTLAALEF